MGLRWRKIRGNQICNTKKKGGNGMENPQKGGSLLWSIPTVAIKGSDSSHPPGGLRFQVPVYDGVIELEC